VQRRGRELDLAVLVEEFDRDVAGLLADPVELVDEVHVPGGAAELAVGRRAEADLLLPADGLADRVVLDAAQLGGVDPPGGEVVARLQQLRRPQQAADVVGPERRSRARRHGGSFRSGVLREPATIASLRQRHRCAIHAGRCR
jgi:hypothetical protein